MIDVLDKLSYTNRLRRWHPGTKVCIVCVMFALCMLLPPLYAAPPVFVVMVFAAVVVAGIPARTYIRILLTPLGFIIAGSITMAFSITGTPGGGLSIRVDPAGVGMALRVSLRALAAVSCLFFLSMTTPVVDIVHVLNACRLPRVFIELLLLSYRFLFVFSETMYRMQTAQAARLGYTGVRESFRSAGMLAAVLFVRVLDRVQRLETGLAARNYDGTLRMLPFNARSDA
ncbi:cobalt ECF transporter T component CbiQ [bacterium]|nr:cobalt ECF transporter T component CbiQ [bacterium]